MKTFAERVKERTGKELKELKILPAKEMLGGQILFSDPKTGARLITVGPSWQDEERNEYFDDFGIILGEILVSDTSSLTDPFDEGYRLGLRHGADEADKADKAWKLRIEICENTGLRPGASNAELIEGLWELNKKLQRPLNTKPQQRQRLKGDDGE